MRIHDERGEDYRMQDWEYHKGFFGVIFHDGKKFKVPKNTIGDIDYRLLEMATKVVDLENGQILKNRNGVNDYVDFSMSLMAYDWPVITDTDRDRYVPPAPKEYKSPSLAVDIIIVLDDGKIVLIERKNPPHGWALPGGFVDYGETLKAAAIREAKEETCLDVEIVSLLNIYDEPDRDPRQHVISAVFIARARNQTPKAADDAKNLKTFDVTSIPDLAFDHDKILNDFIGLAK